MGLKTPEKIRKLQRALHAKAKGSPDFRFYLLYDKIYRRDILEFAYRCSRAKKGSPGVDGQSFSDIETYGVEQWLDDLAEELRKKAYKPKPVKRVYIPKPNGTQRPLGIPTIRDRVVQRAAVLVLEPIFEADLEPEQYAYRPGKDALEAVVEVHRLVNVGHSEVIDADLSGYFDTIPHKELIKSLSRRISDKNVLHQLKMWLKCPIQEDNKRNGNTPKSNHRNPGRGIPQGAPISPLLANIYIRRFILGWKITGCEERYQAHIVNYADDFVICCRKGKANQARKAMSRIIERIGLELNTGKTTQCSLPEGHFDFLGYTIGRCYSSQTGKSYIGTYPSRKSRKHIVNEISEITSRRFNQLRAEEIVERLNRVLRGWSNYFKLGPVSKSYAVIDRHTTLRLRQWLCKKHKQSGKGTKRYPDEYIYDTLRLVRLSTRTHSFPWAKA